MTNQMKLRTQEAYAAWCDSYADVGLHKAFLEARMLQVLMADKVENYGYFDPNAGWVYRDVEGLRCWRRIVGQRARARKAVRDVLACGGVLQWDAAGDRCDLADGSYCVGQSSNEEITNVLRRLVRGNDAAWVS